MTRRLISIILTLLFLIGCNMVVILMFKFIRNIGISLDIGFILIMIILVSVVLYLINIIAIKEYNIKKIYKGYLFSFVYTIIFTVGFIIYLRLFSNFKIIYGVLSFIFIFCFYIYSICIGLLVGICINNEKRINNINGMWLKLKDCLFYY